MNKLPQNIGKYRIQAALGVGAMGVVYEGFDPDIERRVAIKILHPCQESRSLATNPGELDSLTNLLVDYVGPIARNIMVAYDPANTPANKLVCSISKEIPEPGEREEFLKRWEVISGIRIDTTGISNPVTTTGTAEVRSFDDDMLKKMGEDYVGYIGPLAARLVRHHASTTSSLEQLVELLAREIPDAKDSEKFKAHWLRG
jgi:serine/threonine protein kinase